MIQSSELEDSRFKQETHPNNIFYLLYTIFATSGWYFFSGASKSIEENNRTLGYDSLLRWG
jgi:hypothetical protein